MRVELYFYYHPLMEDVNITVTIDGDPEIVDELTKIVKETILKKEDWEEQ